MPLANEFFSAYTLHTMEAEDRSLPLCDSARADLLALLDGDDYYLYLSIADDLHFETVKAVNDHGTLVLTRGIAGTTAVRHPAGSCVKAVSPTILETIKDLICNYKCCEGDCPCEPVSFAGATLPQGTAGQVWHGVVIFSGSAPVKCGVSALPAWMSAKATDNVVELSGTPPDPGEWVVSCAATNCSGELATYAAKIQIS